MSKNFRLNGKLEFKQSAFKKDSKDTNRHAVAVIDGTIHHCNAGACVLHEAKNLVLDRHGYFVRIAKVHLVKSKMSK